MGYFLFLTTTIKPCRHDDPTFAYECFHFKIINEIKFARTNTNVDVVGIFSSTSLALIIRWRDGTETLIKTITLKEMLGFSIDVTLLGDDCESEGKKLAQLCFFHSPPFLLMKGGRVSEFNSITIRKICTNPLIINSNIK